MKAMKGNRIIQINERQKEDYLSMGYTIMDDEEAVLEAPDKDADKLAKEIDSLKAQIKKRDTEIARLNAIIAGNAKVEDKTEEKPSKK